jgi:hypothetical protein
MRRVIIIVNSEAKASGLRSATSPVTERMVVALKQAIAESAPATLVEVVASGVLSATTKELRTLKSEIIYCPLTIQVPEWLDFPGKQIYKDCRDIEARRQWVELNLGHKTSIRDSWLGDLWLPVVLTAKGPLYGEVIGEGVIPNSYEQPADMIDDVRKSLYRLAQKLLQSVSAPPAVYLLQFRLLNKEIVFDRLWPFPAAPAIASLKNQKPDLFAWHWQCLLGEPILDSKIAPASFSF